MHWRRKKKTVMEKYRIELNFMFEPKIAIKSYTNPVKIQIKTGVWIRILMKAFGIYPVWILSHTVPKVIRISV